MKGPYQLALQEAGHDNKLFFDPDLKKGKNKTRKRNITWYNPPYCRSIKTNLGKQFLQIVIECFPPSHKLRKIFNKNSVKLSYSCLPNVGSRILNGTNRKFSNVTSLNQDATKDCVGHRRGAGCPVSNGICNRNNNVYKASITSGNQVFNYVGISAPPLRLRIATHMQSIKGENNGTELSNKCKQLDREGKQYKLQFTLLETRPAYTPESKICQLCNAERYQIVFSKLENLLNHKNEITSKCRHRAKFKLGNIT